MIREVWKTLVELWSHRQGRAIVLSVLAVFGVGTTFYSVVEGWSWLDSFYFTVVTLTTVGYGDFAPSTPLSRGFTVVLILTGVGYILAFLNFLVTRTTERRSRDREEDEDGDV